MVGFILPTEKRTPTNSDQSIGMHLERVLRMNSEYDGRMTADSSHLAQVS